MLLFACNQNNTQEDNLQQLLERQAEIETVKEESVNELDRLKDSLVQEKRALLSQRESQDLQIRQMERDQQMLVEQLKDRESSELSAREDELLGRVQVYKDSIALLKQEVVQLNSHLDSIERSLVYYDVQEQRSVERLASGIEEIDRRMEQREARKMQEKKNLNLLQKRVSVALKKAEAFELERQMYQDELDALMRENASDKKKLPFQEKVLELDSTIAVQNKQISRLEKEIAQAVSYISETDALMKSLKEQVREEHDEKEIIESFILSEKARLNKELAQLQETRSTLLEEQETIHENLAETSQQMEQLNRDAELIRNKEMSDILRMQAENEASEVLLADEEISFLEAVPDPLASLLTEAFESGDSSNEELASLIKMGDQLDSMQHMIQQEKTEIAKTRKALSEQRAEAASRRARLSKTAGSAAIIILIGGVGVLSLFYFLGRRSKKTRRS